jgi:hypothetical protein
VDPLGRVVGTAEFSNDPRGHRALLGWVGDRGLDRVIGIECSLSYGATLSRVLLRSGEVSAHQEDSRPSLRVPAILPRSELSAARQDAAPLSCRHVGGTRENDSMNDEATAYKGDLPGSRRAACLGCGHRVVTARDSHCRITGTRDGSVVLALDAKPFITLATVVDRLFEPGLFLLGVAPPRLRA